MFGKKKAPTVTVFVKSDLGDYITTKPVYVSSDGLKAEVTMWETSPTRASWKFDVCGSLRTMQNGKLYCEVIEGQSKALKVDMTQKDFSFSTLSKDEQQKLLNMKIFKAHYGSLLGDLLQAIKPFLFVGIGLSLAALVCAGIGAYEAYQAQQAITNIYYIP